jgi:hypothetical protein
MALTKIKTKNIKTGSITSDKIVATAISDPKPKITSVAVANSNYYITGDTVVDVAGGYVVITGSNFENGSIASVGQTTALSTTYVNSTTLHAQLDSASAETYNLYVVNTDGSVGLKPNAITFSNPPTWVTGTTLEEQSVDVAFNITFSANDAVSYANTSSLPAGTTLLSNGYFYGTVTGIEDDTTYNFTIKATDAENQESSRTFSLVVVAIPVLLMGYTAGVPSGTTFSQSSILLGGYGADKMFDSSLVGSGPYIWHTAVNPIPCWAKIDFGETPRKIRKYLFMRRDGNDHWPTNYQLQGSNDDTNWTVLDERTNSPPPAVSNENVGTQLSLGNYVEHTVTSSGTYRYYRFYVTETRNGVSETNTYCIVGEMLLYT